MARADQKKTTTFRRNLIIALVALQVATVTLILVFSRISNEKVLIDQASLLLENAAQESLLNTQNFLRPASQVALSATNLLSRDVFKQDKNAIEQYFLTHLKSYSSFVGIYVASAEGEFLYASRNHDKAGYEYRIRRIDIKDAEKRSTLKWLSADLASVSPIEEIYDEYKPSARPWYKAALLQQGLAWTEPYVFFTSKKPGITLAIPFFHEDKTLKGVLGVDIELTDLSDFLTTLNLGESGSALIMSRKQEFVAISGDKLGKRDLLNKLELRFKNQEQQQAAQKVAAIFFEQYNDEEQVGGVKFKVDDTPYIAAFIPFAFEHVSPDWVLATYAPEDTFLKKIRETEQANIMIALVILFLSILIGWVLATRAWRPVEFWHDQAITDQLTGVYNRHHLFNMGKRLYRRSFHSKKPLSLALVDIDDFKEVNDTHGHNIGDEVLANLAWRIRTEMRPEDLVARFGGEEFVIMLQDTDEQSAVKAIERLQEVLRREQVQTSKGMIPVALSVGLTSTEKVVTRMPFVAFIERADQALYKAKAAGKDRLIKW